MNKVDTRSGHAAHVVGGSQALGEPGGFIPSHLAADQDLFDDPMESLPATMLAQAPYGGAGFGPSSQFSDRPVPRSSAPIAITGAHGARDPVGSDGGMDMDLGLEGAALDISIMGGSAPPATPIAGRGPVSFPALDDDPVLGDTVGGSRGLPNLASIPMGGYGGSLGRGAGRGRGRGVMSAATFFDTMQAAGLGAYPSFRAGKGSKGGEDGSGTTFFDGPVWERMPEPADPLSPYVFDDVHALGMGPSSAPGDLPFLRQAGFGRGDAMSGDEGEDDEDDEDMGSAGEAEAGDGGGARRQGGAGAGAGAGAGGSGSNGSSDSSDEEDEDLFGDAGSSTAAMHAVLASAAGSMKGSRRRMISAGSKRERGVAPGRTPFVAGQHSNPSRFFIDVEATVLPHSALTWLLDKVEAQEHSAKTCRYYLSKSPVCSGECRMPLSAACRCRPPPGRCSGPLVCARRPTRLTPPSLTLGCCAWRGV